MTIQYSFAVELLATTNFLFVTFATSNLIRRNQFRDPGVAIVQSDEEMELNLATGTLPS